MVNNSLRQVTSEAYSEESVWHSDCLIVSEHGAGSYMKTIDDRHARERVKMHQLVQTGAALERGAFAEGLQITDEKRDTAPLDDFIMMGFPSVSAAFKAFLETENIGEPVFYPIEIYLTDGVTKRPETYFILNLRCQQRFWVPEETHINAAAQIVEGRWLAASWQPDGRFGVLKEALFGADLWFDPRLQGALFFSDRLKSAIQASGLRPQFRFRSCKIVG